MKYTYRLIVSLSVSRSKEEKTSGMSWMRKDTIKERFDKKNSTPSVSPIAMSHKFVMSMSKSKMKM